VLGGLLLALFVVATASAGSAGRPYRSTVFHPAFRLELPKGWVVAERGPDVAQIYRRCSRCAHEGEENGEITFDLALAKLSPAKAIALLRRTPGIRATRVRSVSYGTLRGLGFTARRDAYVENRYGCGQVNGQAVLEWPRNELPWLWTYRRGSGRTGNLASQN
jgi:hypothetical protein